VSFPDSSRPDHVTLNNILTAEDPQHALQGIS